MPGSSRSASLRKLALLVHRYVGLAMATFLVVAGVTGSLIAFYAELDAALNPELFSVTPPEPGASMLDPVTIRDRLVEQLPNERVHRMVLDLRPGESVNYWVDGREYFVDPYTGRVIGSRTFGDLTEGKKNLWAFVYRLHFSLGLGDVGAWIFGVVALLWTVDCFVGAYLTFPPVPRSRGGAAQSVTRAGRAWLASWGRMWLIKTTRLFSLVFTWHRASGLWAWGMFFVFAWSGVALSFHEEIYHPVMHAVVGGDESDWAKAQTLPEPKNTPAISFQSALDIGRQRMAEEAKRRRFRILGERDIKYDPARGIFLYTVESSLDISSRLADTYVLFDGDTGEGRGFGAPSGQQRTSTIAAWLIALHFGSVHVGGLPYRILVSVLGLAVAALSVTGVWIWWKKRSKRGLAGPSRESVANA